MSTFGNQQMGISIDHSANNQIGGTRVDGNVIVNSGIYGIQISGRHSMHNRIQGNHVGIDATGTKARPNKRSGIVLFNAGYNIIGGELGSTGNLISGNGRHGINIDGSATRPAVGAAFGGCGDGRGNVVVRNRIGTDLSGEHAVPNGMHGIIMFLSGGSRIGVSRTMK